VKLLHGTSSWSEKSWVGPFYPEGTRPADMLAFYATQFPTVEADTTYYRIPPREMVRGWRTKTPEGFVVSAKFPRSVVHGGEGIAPDATKLLDWSVVGGDVERFLDAMSELGPKQGPLVVQLPYLNRSAFASVEPFLERLDAFLEWLPSGPRYGIEVRNKNWIEEPLLALLRKRNMALVLVDIAYMPHPALLAERLDLVTSDFVYARLIGDRKAVEEKTETFDRIVLDQSEKLARWAELLEHLGSRVRETFAYANNHYAGFGPATIRELVRRLSGE
jgi:uncharacterized protein YecE (DUF72 family)